MGVILKLIMAGASRSSIVAKYGKINVDLKDGSYTVVEEENQE